MRNLERVSGFPRSAIRFYLREGILPPARKTAPNAAVYSETHVERLRIIERLRQEGSGFPMALLRRAPELMDRGIEPELATELAKAVAGGVPAVGSTGSGPYSAEELAIAANVPLEFVQRVVQAGVLVPLPENDAGFDATDVCLIQSIHSLVQATGLDIELASRISSSIRDLSRYEMNLRNRAVKALDDQAGADLPLQFQQSVNLLHTYLFYRWRCHDIAILQAQAQAQEQEHGVSS